MKAFYTAFSRALSPFDRSVFRGLIVLLWIMTALLLARAKAQSVESPFTDINPVMSLTGQWSPATDTAQVQIRMDNNGRSFTLDMQALDRPMAYGEFVSDQIIEVNFPDSQALSGRLDPVKRTITWSDKSVWSLVYKSASTQNTQLVELKR